MKRQRDKDRCEFVAWCGRWNDGRIGWAMPEHAYDGNYSTRPYVRADDVLTRVRITVEAVKTKQGRAITRRAGKIRR